MSIVDTIDYNVVDTVPGDRLELNDNILFTDEDGELHQGTITFIEDIGDCYDVTAYSETVGEKVDTIIDYDQDVELWQWR